MEWLAHSRGSTAKKLFFTRLSDQAQIFVRCSPKYVLSCCKRNLFSFGVLVTFDFCLHALSAMRCEGENVFSNPEAFGGAFLPVEECFVPVNLRYQIPCSLTVISEPEGETLPLLTR